MARRESAILRRHTWPALDGENLRAEQFLDTDVHQCGAIQWSIWVLKCCFGACLCSLSSGWLFSTPLTLAHQASLSMGFSMQEYWRGLPFPTLGDLPNPRIGPGFPALAGRFFTVEPPGRVQNLDFFWWSASMLPVPSSWCISYSRRLDSAVLISELSFGFRCKTLASLKMWIIKGKSRIGSASCQSMWINVLENKSSHMESSSESHCPALHSTWSYTCCQTHQLLETVKLHSIELLCILISWLLWTLGSCFFFK